MITLDTATSPRLRQGGSVETPSLPRPFKITRIRFDGSSAPHDSPATAYDAMSTSTVQTLQVQQARGIVALAVSLSPLYLLMQTRSESRSACLPRSCLASVWLRNDS